MMFEVTLVMWPENLAIEKLFTEKDTRSDSDSDETVSTSSASSVQNQS